MSVTLVTMAAFEWLDEEESTQPVVIPSSTSTPLAIPSFTPSPTISVVTPTPVIDPFDFAGVRFDGVSELEILDGVFFSKEDPRIATIIIELPDGSYATLSFLPITYFQWMGEENFGMYCLFKSGKGCVFNSGGNLTILVHTGCKKDDPVPAVAEYLGAYLDDRTLCGYPKRAPKPSHYETVLSSTARILQGDTAVEALVVHVEYVPPERLAEFSQSMESSHIADYIGRKEVEERLIYLITSSRLRGCEPEYSCGRWLLVLKESKEG